VSASEIDLAWMASSDDVGVTGYLVERCQGAGCSGFAQVASVAGTSFADTGLAAGTSYGYRVRARDAAGNLGAYSSVASAATPPGAAATPAYVQGAFSCPQTPQSTVRVTYAGAQAAGGLDVVIAGWNDSSARVISVTDSAGNVYALAVGPTVIAGAASQAIYYAKNIVAAPAGANVVTVAFDRPAIYPDVRIAEYRGVDTAAPLDVAAAASGTASPSDSGPAVTTNPVDLLVAGNLVLSGTSGAGSGFTSRMITSPDSDILEDRTVTAAGTYRATAPLTSPAPWIMQMVAFKAAVAPAP
jgi:hypothetical protein